MSPQKEVFYAPVGRVSVQDRRELWGVGRADLPIGTVPYYLSHHDIQADTAWMEGILERLGIQPGRGMYIAHSSDQLGQIWPVFLAAMSHRIPAGTGQNSRYDAYRLEMFLRRLPTDLVFGVSAELLIGLGDAGHDPMDVLSRAPILVAYPDAWQALAAAGRRFWKMLNVGPVLAFEPPEGGGFIYDSAEWRVESDGQGRLLLSAADPARACGFSMVDVGLHGQVCTHQGTSRIFPLFKDN